MLMGKLTFTLSHGITSWPSGLDERGLVVFGSKGCVDLEICDFLFTSCLETESRLVVF